MEKIYIKNMVCQRCISAVEETFTKNGIVPESVQLGGVILSEKPSPNMEQQLKQQLEHQGFEWIEDKNAVVINRVKSLIIDEIFHNKQQKKQEENYSTFLERQLLMDYSSISSLFTAVEGRTLENYIIHQKIERAKELLIYDEKTLSGIAWQLGYSSVHHLSAQFKKVTGLTPSHFKKIGLEKRQQIDRV